MNHALKKTSAKLCQETHEPWVQLLPIALLRIATAPEPSLRLSPFEMTWETPPHPRYFTRWENKPELAAFYLGQVEKAIVDYANHMLPAPPSGNLEETTPPHHLCKFIQGLRPSLKPPWKEGSLEDQLLPKWKGPY